MRLSITSEADAVSGFACDASIRYARVPGLPFWDGDLTLDLLLPDPRPSSPAPAVVYLHGGGWRNGDKGAGMYPWISPLLAAHGFVAVNVDYRLTGVSAFPAQLHDAKAAIRWLRSQAGAYGIDPTRIGAWGDSAGGHLAALLGTTGGLGPGDELEGYSADPAYDPVGARESSAVQAVVARCTPSDFAAWEGIQDAEDEALSGLFGAPAPWPVEVLRRASPVTYARAGVPPFLVVHGTRDETVPFAQGVRLTDAVRAAGGDATLRVVEGGHHSMRVEPDGAWGTNEPWTTLGREALAFFTTQLRGRPPEPPR